MSVDRYPNDHVRVRRGNFPQVIRGAPAGQPGRDKRKKGGGYKLPKRGPPNPKPLRPDGPKQWPGGYPSKKAAATVARRLGSAVAKAHPVVRIADTALQAVQLLNALDEWSDTWWKDSVVVHPAADESVPDPDYWGASFECLGHQAKTPQRWVHSLPNGSCSRLYEAYVYGETDSTSTNLIYGLFYEGYIFGTGSPPQERVVEIKEKKAGSPSPTPVFEFPSPQVFPVVNSGTELTWEFPLEWPYPQSWADAVAEPGTQPDGSPDPKPSPSRQDNQAPTVTVPTIPGLRIALLPDLGVVPVTETQLITVPPGDNVVEETTIPPPRTISRPPLGVGGGRGRSHVKERKTRLTPFQAGVWASIGVITEGLDFLEVLHDALPKSLRADRKSGWSKPKAHDMAEAVWANFDKIDVGKAIENYINEWMEDMFYAGLGRAGKSLNQLTGQATGGGRALNNNASEFGEDNPVKPPELYLDVETGNWEFDTPFGVIHGALGR